ncbi:uncharacterized protein [Montipora foliosa]|uniref:uncharacterized protein n=1 Tax=Montipora foliosa TaxID=591990 RepID=UPI0035F211CC
MHEEVTIVPADKGRSVVVMDKDEYQEKVSVLLNDTNTYLKITDKRSNPTSNVEKELNIKEEKDDSGSQIGPQLYKKLHCSNSTPASFYGLPKIHKPERPLRPITSSIGSPTYAVSKHLVSILSPLRRNRFSVKNSSEFAQKIEQHTVASDEIMVSFDVKSLFPSILVDLVLTIVNERLQKDHAGSSGTHKYVHQQHHEAVRSQLLQTQQHPLQTILWMCDGFPIQSRYSRPRNGRD